MTVSTAFAMMCRTVLPIPIGRTLGFLFRAINPQAVSEETILRLTKVLQRSLANRTIEEQSSSEADLKDEYNLLQL